MGKACTFLLAITCLQSSDHEAVAPLPDTTPWPKRISLSYNHSSSHCTHWWDDYARLGMSLAPQYNLGQMLPMLDLQWDRVNSHTYKTHLGIAGRHIPLSSSFSHLFGWNLFYDYRTGPFHHIGLGMEMLGRRLDVRANLYVPLTPWHVKKRTFHYIGGYFATRRRVTYSLYGANAEVGYLAVNKKNFLLYAAAGPYYFFRPSFAQIIGFKARIRPQYRDYLALDLAVTSDNYCNTAFQIEFIFSLPLYQLSSKSSPSLTRFTQRQIYQPIERIDPYGTRCCWNTNFPNPVSSCSSNL